MVVFWGEGKPEYPEKTSRCREENQQTQPTYDARSGNQTHANLWEASVLTTAPSLHPKKHFIFQYSMFSSHKLWSKVTLAWDLHNSIKSCLKSEFFISSPPWYFAASFVAGSPFGRNDSDASATASSLLCSTPVHSCTKWKIFTSVSKFTIKRKQSRRQKYKGK